jgi:fatty acid kinase
VVRTESIPAGLAAMVAFVASTDAETNGGEMAAAAAAVASGAVTVASRDAQLNGMAIRRGNFLGLADGEPVAQGATFDEVAQAVVERLLAEPRETLTLLTGEEERDVSALVRTVEQRHPAVALEVHEGGQPHYALLIAAE